MSRRSALCAVVLALLSMLLFVPVAAAGTTPAPGTMTEHSYTNSAGTRTYYLYVPTKGAAGKPLMIWLHGCGGPQTMQPGIGLTRTAEDMGFALAYPVQSQSANPLLCWNWYLPTDTGRGAGEASIIAGITTSLVRELHSDPRRVYVGGYSAGGAMTSVMGAAYPDLYAAIAPNAGAPYRLDPTGLLAYLEMGPRARPVPAWILQGLLDEISNYVIGRTNLLQWLDTDDLADDGSLDNSVPHLPSSVGSFHASAVPLPLLVEHYRTGGCEVARFLTSIYDHMLDGELFADNAGNDVQRNMMGFLLAHRLGAAHRGCG